MGPPAAQRRLPIGTQNRMALNRNSSDQIGHREPDRPSVYTSEMAEETCGVTDKAAPSRCSTK